MEDRTQLKIAFKSMRKASKALRRSAKTNESKVERLELAPMIFGKRPELGPI